MCWCLFQFSALLSSMVARKKTTSELSNESLLTVVSRQQELTCLFLDVHSVWKAKESKNARTSHVFYTDFTLVIRINFQHVKYCI